MRTTLTLEDNTIRALKEQAYSSGRSFKETVNEVLRLGLSVVKTSPEPRRYRIKPASLGGVKPGIDLTKALRLSDALEDEGIRRKLELRK